MGKFVFICALVISIACVYCNDDEQTLNTILRNQVKNIKYASDDESDMENVTCDCSYRSKSFWAGGGCRIVHIAPPGFACYCKYKGAWTCSGTVTTCVDKRNKYCKNPDRSKESCLQGDGDCGGYP